MQLLIAHPVGNLEDSKHRDEPHPGQHVADDSPSRGFGPLQVAEVHVVCDQGRAHHQGSDDRVVQVRGVALASPSR